ncbi:hypothetical protein NDU88_001698 [Pleurodeles waltl]|uniref:Uncharacterized protein n=1 Tax=Pleurodeles waltl TaxID=8319 RepID=A0AAV7LAA6_PLEWA|nr:hypothetical protein NDU88_001698 [Pleurodeles waltl]
MRSRAQPMRTQTAVEWSKVLKEASLHTHNSFTALRIPSGGQTDSDSGESDSTVTEVPKGPTITPWTADEL